MALQTFALDAFCRCAWNDVAPATAKTAIVCSERKDVLAPTPREQLAWDASVLSHGAERPFGAAPVQGRGRCTKCLPFAAIDALLTLYVFHIDLSVYALVRIILLVGLVKKNAIMMVDVAIEAERNEAISPADAIVHASLIRFRPIMMPTVAALMGSLPIAFAIGAGAESRRPLGVAVVGGLAFSQLVTLYVTPSCTRICTA